MHVRDAFDKNWVAPVGPHLNAFEEMIAKRCHRTQAAALSSGTAAIHLGLKLLGVEKDDYVICQSFTFAGSANPITYLGAKPVFVDSEAGTWNIDPSILEEAINRLPKRPKCIVPVHLYGMPARMTEIQEIASKYEIPILEDAAEALGSYYFDAPCGSFGELSVLSFNGNKIITTSGGGALIGNDKSLIEKSKFLATQARDNAPHYQHSEIGYNYRLSNISAAIGIGQLEVLEVRVRQRKANFQRYKDFFEMINKRGYEISFQPEMEGFSSNRWLTCLVIDPEKNNRITSEDLRNSMAERNIESRPLWKPMHLQPIYESSIYYGGNVAEKLFEMGLCLPSGSNLSEQDFDRIFNSIDEILK